ncbi:MAG TPA: two-component system response regulator NarL [Nevskiales bacterium]|nr:two-component system response regulator NarL [Nevskiales bacterium]
MSQSNRNTVLIIDDHPIFRNGISQLIEFGGDFQKIGEAASGAEGIELAKRHKPDLILLDLNMRGMNGIQTLKALKEMDLDSLVIIVTVSNAEEDLVAALRVGADGYLLKDMEPEEFMAKLRSAAAGQVILDERLTKLLAHALRGDNHTPEPSEVALTNREWEILTLIADGLCNKLIARELSISDGTVKVHVKHLLQKLNLRSRLEAAAWAHQNGITRARH